MEQNSHPNPDAASLSDLMMLGKQALYYLQSRTKQIVLIVLIFISGGISYSLFKPKIYTAQVSFIAEEGQSGKSASGALALLGSQFGGASMSSSSLFEGENLKTLFKTKKLIYATLFSIVESPQTGQPTRLINLYLQNHAKDGAIFSHKNTDTLHLEKISEGSLAENMTLSAVYNSIVSNLVLETKSKKSQIIYVTLGDNNEYFTKVFVDQLINKVTRYYVEYKTQREETNVRILQRQVDSVKALLFGTIDNLAETQDLNVNPIKQMARIGNQRQQIQLNINNALYSELVKNLEAAKLSLRRETPLIQIIDKQEFPLRSNQLSILKAIVYAGIGGLVLSICFFLAVFYFKQNLRM